MVTGLEKIVKHFINGKEYSPGLIVNIVSVNVIYNISSSRMRNFIK